MRCTQLFDGDGATDVGRLVVGFAVDEDECDVEDVGGLLGIREVDGAEVVVAADRAEPALPPDEHPARTIAEARQVLATRTN